jgi:imidazolonepropionase-like amidohydrolase
MIVAPRQESRSSGGAGVTSRWTWTSLLVLLALAAGCATAPSRGAGRAPEDGTRPAGAAAVALVGGTLIDGTGAPPRRGTVLIRGGRIACVGECPLDGGAAVVDATGKYLTPGLVDGHMHYSQTGWVDARPDAEDVRARFPYDSTIAALEAHPERLYRSYLCSGVTATFDVGGYPWTWRLRKPAEADPSAPHVAAAGPLLATIDHWVNLPASRQFVHMAGDSATRAAARMIARFGSDAVKVWYIVEGPRPDTTALKAVVRSAADEARRARVPLIVHATGLWEAKDALRVGAHLLVHSVDDAVVDEEFIRLARAAGTIYMPTLTVLDGYRQLYERRFDPEGLPMECVDPATRARAQQTGSLPARTLGPGFAPYFERYRQTTRENLRRVHAAGIPVAMGTDAGNPLTLHGASVFREMEAMAQAGMPPADVLASSTRIAARAMGRDDIGTLEPGKIADLLVLSRDPLQDISHMRSIVLVVRAGKVWRREELEYR